MTRVAIIAFTRKGCALATRIAQELSEKGRLRAPSLGADDAVEVTVSGPARFASEAGVDAYSSLDAWTKASFSTADVLLFVSATGIAVRAIAPYVNDKFVDPAVVSIDERAQFAVPLLSGHVGGANEFAQAVAQMLGAHAVVSTATDVNGVFSVDVWAREQGLAITDRELAKQVSAALLEGIPVGFVSDYPVEGALPTGLVAVSAGEHPLYALGICVSLDEGKRPFDKTLVLVPRIVSLGVGCRKGTDVQVFAQVVVSALEEAGISLSALSQVASIDVKANEAAIVAFASDRELSMRFFSAAELNAVEGTFTASDFVHETVGVDNVCERAARAALDNSTLIMRKTANKGVTVAAALPKSYTLSFENAMKGCCSTDAASGSFAKDAISE